MDTINHQGFSKRMIMKKYYYTIFLVLISFSALAQKPTLKKANKLFAKKAYTEAAQMYKAIESTKEVLQNMGDAYYYNFKMSQAVDAYNQLFTKHRDSVDLDYYFRYGQALKGTKDYKLADSLLSIYLDRKINTLKLIDDLQTEAAYLYELTPMEGTTEGDFGITLFNNKLIFSATRNAESPLYRWNDQPYLDLYEATINDDGSLSDIKPFSDKINTDTHESNATFTADGQTMYFSRTNKNRIVVNKEKVAHVKLYKAELVDSVWTKVKELPFSSDEYSTEHPMLSKDNSKLFFASNMSGTTGSFDIYYVDINEDGYGDPVNIGAPINTVQREQFPYIGEENVLYFASDGHDGMGGLDMFSSQPDENGEFLKPENLGTTINSNMDDFGFVVDTSKSTGYISSNRDGVDKIYTFIRRENLQEYIVEGIATDKNSKELLPGTTVSLFKATGERVDEMLVGDDAKYEFKTEPNTSYRIEGYRPFYVPTVETFTTNYEGRIEFNIELEIESYDDAEEIVVTKDDGYIYIELENIYFDLNKWDIKAQAAETLDILVGLLKKYPRMEVQLGAHTDTRSSFEYNIRLSDNRARATLEYIVANGIERRRLRSKGYGESQPLVNCGDDCTETEHSINRRCEFVITR